eukprot:5619515-Pleurochrysis_carterae.AAC.1
MVESSFGWRGGEDLGQKELARVGERFEKISRSASSREALRSAVPSESAKVTKSRWNMTRSRKEKPSAGA